MVGKIIITGKIRLQTGMHIGSGIGDVSIGAADQTVVRDTSTDLPMIPGSSLKGKTRYLLKRFGKEDDKIAKLYGCSEKHYLSRLQFRDCFICNSLDNRTEIKYENTIDEKGKATPRQIERVVKGAEFNLSLIYNVEDIEAVKSDFKLLATAFKYLQLDYLGGHGTRGYGRVVITDMSCSIPQLFISDLKLNVEELKEILDGVNNYAQVK